MSSCKIYDESTNHHYRTEIPNILFDIGLKANQLALYLAIKRTAGDKGECFKSRNSLCKEAGIGTRIYPKIKAELSQIQKLINKPLIISKTRFNECGDQDTDELIIVDIWPENNQYFQNKIQGRAKTHGGRAELHGGVAQNCTQGRAELHPKEEPLKKNHIKNPPPLSSKSTNEGEAGNIQAINSLIDEAVKRKFPFSKGAMFAIYKKTSGNALTEALQIYMKRSKNAKSLDYPDEWLKKEVLQQYEYELQKKEAQGLI